MAGPAGTQMDGLEMGIAGMDDTSLRALLDSAVRDEPPIGPVGRNSLRKGIRLRRRARMRRAAGATAAVATMVPVVTGMLGNRGAAPSAGPPTSSCSNRRQ